MIFGLVALIMIAGLAFFLASEFGMSPVDLIPGDGSAGSGAPDASSSDISTNSPPADTSAADSTSATSSDPASAAPAVTNQAPAAGPASSAPGNIEQWRNLAEKYAQIFSILQPEEILAIIWNESSGNPAAVRHDPSTTSYGLMQITPPIALKYGGLTLPGQYMDPDSNVKAGSGFLADLKGQLSADFPITDPNVAWVAGYNEGETNLRKHRADPVYIARYLDHLAKLGGTPE